jgi:hypothetical protein
MAALAISDAGLQKPSCFCAEIGQLRSAGFTGGYDLRIVPDIALANAA